MADVSGGKSALLSLAVRCDPTTRFEEEPGLLGAASLTKFQESLSSEFWASEA